MLKKIFPRRTENIQGQSANICLKCLFLSSCCILQSCVKDLAQPVGSYRLSVPVMSKAAIIQCELAESDTLNTF